jgi:hypothetical protein
MIVKGKTMGIINSVVSYESGISWRPVNKRMAAIDYGIETDHVSAKLSVWGTMADIAEFRNKIAEVSEKIIITFDKGEMPFGPAFDCEGEKEYLLIDIEDITTANKGIAQMSFQLAALWALTPPWTYRAIEFSLANFAVQEVKRESEENKSVYQTESGWTAFRHGWNRPKLTLSLLANSEIMGGTIEWLITGRVTPFAINCNSSMALIDSQSEMVLCVSFGNLRRLGNSNFWQADFDFAIVNSDSETLCVLTEDGLSLATETGKLLRREGSWQMI